MTANGSSVYARNDELREALRRAASALTAVRAIREQVDWEQVRASTAENAFAAAFLLLVARLGITDPCQPLPRR